MDLEAELASPRPLQKLEIVHNGQVISAKIEKRKEDGIHRWRIRQRVKVTRSSWLAARGIGGPKRALEQHTKRKQNTIAHTGAVRVLVDDQPILVTEDAKAIHRHLVQQQAYYRTKAKYQKAEHRTRVLRLFDAGIRNIQDRLDP